MIRFHLFSYSSILYLFQIDDNGLFYGNIFSKMETMKIQNLEDLIAFTKVAETSGFSSAAKALGVPVSVVSKRISRLEDQLGVRLFQRSTRAVHLTEDGGLLMPQIQRLIGDIREIEDQFTNQKILKGKIRLTVPWTLTQGPLPKILADFHKEHPEVEISVHFSDTIEKLVEGGYDLAIRFTTLTDSNLIARRLGPNPLVMVASAQYLKKYGTPKTVKDLKNHKLLMLPIHRTRKFLKHPQAIGELATTLGFHSNNGLFLTELARNGEGIAIRSGWDVAELIKRKELIELKLNDKLEAGFDAYIVTPSNRYMSPRVRALLDMIVERFSL
jgi:LysR family transcriptional activator of dmlA